LSVNVATPVAPVPFGGTSCAALSRAPNWCGRASSAPRISPPGLSIVCTFTYQSPACRSAIWPADSGSDEPLHCVGPPMSETSMPPEELWKCAAVPLRPKVRRS
jgi:hypothetical protein